MEIEPRTQRTRGAAGDEATLGAPGSRVGWSGVVWPEVSTTKAMPRLPLRSFEARHLLGDSLYFEDVTSCR